MRLRDSLIKLLTRVGLAVVTMMVLRLPDPVLARLLAGAARLIYALTGDKALFAQVAEAAQVFASGPPGTTTVRKMIRAAEPQTAASAICCLTRHSPYGAA